MYKLCNIDIRHRDAILPELERFIDRLKAEFAISSVYLFGSFITGRLHEGSDIDVLVVGDFHDRFVDRIRKVLDLTDLPIEPLAYTDNEFAEMLQNHDPFLISILQNAHQLLSAAKES